MYDKKDAIPRQDGPYELPTIGTELSAQYKYGVILSRMPPFQQATPSCTTDSARPQGSFWPTSSSMATIGSGPWDKVKRFSAPFVPRPHAPAGTGHYEGK